AVVSRPASGCASTWSFSCRITASFTANAAARKTNSAPRWRGRALETRVMDLLQRLPQAVATRPRRVVVREPLHRADPPHVIARPVLVAVRPVQAASGDLLTQVDRLEDRATRRSAAADVVHLARAGMLDELPHRP